MSLRGKIEFAEITDTGRVRDHNEDAIGSDPEIGLLVHSSELAGEVADFIELGMRPDNSYELALNPSRSDAEGPLLWRNAEDGRAVRHTAEPEVGMGAEIAAWLLSLLPIEDQL